MLVTHLLMAALGAAIGVIVATLWRNHGNSAGMQGIAGNSSASCTEFEISSYDEHTCTAHLEVSGPAPTAFFALRIPATEPPPEPTHPPWERGRWYPGQTGNDVQLENVPATRVASDCNLYVWAVCLDLSVLSPVSCASCNSPTPPGSSGPEQQN